MTVHFQNITAVFEKTFDVSIEWKLIYYFVIFSIYNWGIIKYWIVGSFECCIIIIFGIFMKS